MTKAGIKYFDEMSDFELFLGTQVVRLQCDNCLKSLDGMEDIVLIPVLNYACCKECGEKVLGRVRVYKEDKYVESKRVEYWLKVISGGLQ